MKLSVTGLKSLLRRSTNDGVRRQVLGALAALGVKSEDPKTADDVSQGASKTATERRMQLFISYQHASKDTVFKLRDRLLRQGYGVWIDADYMCEFRYQFRTRGGGGIRGALF